MAFKHAVVLICDKNFFLPTFASALSARRHLTRGDVLIRILVTDADAAWCERLGAAGRAKTISIMPAPVSEIAALQPHHRDRYLPVAALSRFWVDRFLEPEIERFLYLDGDVLVDGDLDEIFSAIMPAGGMLAASDTVCLCLNELGPGPKREQAYLQSLGLDNGEYFNSGVILASRDGWRAIADDAVAFLIANGEVCRSSDQSALNAVAGDRLGRLSLRWNYQSDHMTLLDPRTIGIKPVIWHFTGAPKPWHCADWPWDESFNWAYRDAEKLLDGLGIANPRPSAAQLDAGLAHRRRARKRLQWLYPWRRLTRRKAIRAQLAG